MPTLVGKQSVLLPPASRFCSVNRMCMSTSQHLLQTQALAARQHVVSSWSRGRQLCTTCRVRPSSGGSLQPPFAESECVCMCACSDNGYRRAQQFFTPHHTWLYWHGNGYRVCSWHAGTDRGVEVGEREAEEHCTPWSCQTARAGLED